MAKHTAKEIGRLAGRAFAAITPANWALRSQEDQEDYGIDYEVELTTQDDAATGFIFKIQQKGTEGATLVENGQSVSFSGLGTEKLRYYLHSLRIPTVFVLVDVETKKSYWIALHGNRDVAARLKAAVEAGHDTLTLHLPVRNVLPDTVDELLDAVASMFDHVTLVSLREMPIPDAQAAIAREPDLDELERSLRVKQALIRHEKTQRLLAAGKLREAFDLNVLALRDDTEPVEGRFSAGLETMRIMGGSVASSTDPTARERLLKTRFTVTHELVRISRASGAPDHLQRYAVFLARSSRLRLRADQDFGIFLSRKAQEHGADNFTRWMTRGGQQRSTSQVLHEFRSCQRHVITALERGWWGLLGHMWAELSEAIIPFLLRLREDDLEEGADSVLEWLDAVGEVCFHAAKVAGETGSLELVALNHVRLGVGSDSFDGRAANAAALLAAIEDERARSEALQELEKVVDRLSGDAGEAGPQTQERLAPLIRQMARGLGVDLDDPNDDIARILRIGIVDANPERVLKNCRHLYVSIDSYGIPAEMVGLPTAGLKSVHCTKHGYRTSGLSLDSTYSLLQVTKCASCNDCQPHPPEWRWSQEWQWREFEKHEPDDGDLGT